MLELNGISFSRNGKKILDNVSLKLDGKKIVAITGPNGSGKSTLCKIIMGIEKADSGQVLLDGVDITNYTIDERANLNISFAFQQPVKFKGITVYDLVRLSSRRDMNKGEVCNVLSKVGLCAKEYIDREVDSSLSGGELKRIEIATIAVRNSKVTIFDEPEAGIDLWSFNNLIDIFEDVKEITNGLSIVISHQEKILKIADEVILLKDGKIEKIYKNKENFSEIPAITDCCKLKRGKHNE